MAGLWKRGIFFTVDAVFALLALLSIMSLFTLVTLESVSPEFMHESLHAQTGDMIGMMAKLKLSDLWGEPEVRALYYAGYLNDKDMNSTLLEVNGALWALNTTNDTKAAQNLTKLVLTNMVPGTVNWAFTVMNETLYNTTSLDSSGRIVTISRRLVSGYMKSKPHTGYAARAFLSNIIGQQSSKYFFFGGFVGQGNVTATIRDIPSDANLSHIYMEMNIENNFTLSINGNSCGMFNKTGTNFTVYSWTINSSACLGFINRGQPNNFSLNFTGNNVSAQYVGGGYIKVVYDTAIIGDILTGVQRYYFPGIDGIVNLYDSFYVPGSLRNITGYLKVKNNYTTTFVIGNKTILEGNGTSSVQEIYLYDINFTSAGLDYSKLGQVTVPHRLRAGANVSGGTIGIADVILITDVSGSMAWRIGYSDSTPGQTAGIDCNNLNNTTNASTQKLALAKCLDKIFVDYVLNGTGNKVGLVSFSEGVVNSTDLSTSKSYLNATINSYTTMGGTCICCSINKAREILAAQSDGSRLKYIVVMTDGIANIKCDDPAASTASQGCYWWRPESSPGSTRPYYDVDFVNDTRVFVAGSRTSSGNTYGRIAVWNGASWASAYTTIPILRGIDVVNSTLAFVVGDSGNIYKWSGGASNNWAVASGSPISGNPNLLSVAIVNDTLGYAVGAGGRLISWNGSSWTSNSTFTSTPQLNRIRFNENRTVGFIVGNNGTRGVIYRWTYPTWTLEYSDGDNLYGIAFSNRTDYPAYAFGNNGRILRWNGSVWSTDVSNTVANFRTGFFINDTFGYAIATNGDFQRWNGTWFLGDDNINDAFYGSVLVNSTLAIAVGGVSGTRATVRYWKPLFWQSGDPDPEGYSCCGGQTTDCDNPNCEAPVRNAIWGSGYANSTLNNLTVDTIGFGNFSACENGLCVLTGMAEAGNGNATFSTDPSELLEIYSNLGLGILINATTMQEFSVIGGVVTTLYPESYLEFTFDMVTPPLGYKEVSVTQETPPLGNCSGNFTISGWLTPYEARVTSYSANYWTHNVSVKSGNTGGEWQNVFNLSTYSFPYTQLGDPYNVMFPASLLKANETNYINVTTGLNPSNESSECPTGNRVIYKAKFPAAVPFSSVLPLAVGRNVTVYYDMNGDGVGDGSTSVLIGYGIDGVPFDPTPRNVSSLDPEMNALDDAFIRLLDYINFNQYSTCTVPGAQNRSGMDCNPIDVQLSPDILFRISSVNEVPYMWGPIDMGIVSWVKEE